MREEYFMKNSIETIRTYFPALQDKIYMNTATQNIGNQLASEALHHALTQWTRGEFDWLQAEEMGEENRAFFANIIGAKLEEIALVPFASTAAGIVAAQFGKAHNNENIVVSEQEFTSNLFPWRMLENKGYQLRLIPSQEGIVPAEMYADYTDSATRLIAVSAVNAKNGYQVDLDILSAIAHQHGAWLYVDACQAVGAIPLTVKDIDFLAATSHKFLLGTRGTGYLYVRQNLLPVITPVIPGWKAAEAPLMSFFGPDMRLAKDASRLDSSLAWFNVLADRASFQIFERFGVKNILEHNAYLIQYLHESLQAHDLSFNTFIPPRRSTIFSIALPNPEQAVLKLRDAGIVASIRGEFIRLSLHVYNLKSEIDEVVTLIANLR